MAHSTDNLPKQTLYEALQCHFQNMLQRAETGKVHLRANDILWERNRHAHLGYYLHPFITDTALHTMQLFQNVIKQHGGMHRHQGGVVIFVIEGNGYTIADEVRVDWEAGDLILLPMRPGGVAHQHFNLDPDKPARWLAFISNAFREHSGYEIVQLTDSPEWGEGEKAPAEKDLHRPIERPQMLQAAPRRESETPRTLLDELFAMRDEFRERNRTGLKVVRGKDLPWEQNAQGKMQWYVHPRKPDTCTKTFVLYVQEMPPQGRSGRQRVPGGIAHVVLSGRMIAEVDGRRYECEELDCIALPIKHRGVEYQFFNPDPQKPCRLIAGSPNFYEILGLDMGSEFEQLEEAPA
jgi:gentisate 1,2-dioxygenase